MDKDAAHASVLSHLSSYRLREVLNGVEGGALDLWCGGAAVDLRQACGGALPDLQWSCARPLMLSAFAPWLNCRVAHSDKNIVLSHGCRPGRREYTIRYLYLSKLVKISGASGAIAHLILDQLHVNIFGRGAYHVSRLAIYWLENPMTRKQKNFLEI
ncbi:uncharacterized protein [Miscanthus floridulus]|uniref:uncharacterized protein isoform X1 n=1 Tax=Miscanthus floridulus TaxID=154761 RepID=UPI00345A7664